MSVRFACILSSAYSAKTPIQLPATQNGNFSIVAEPESLPLVNILTELALPFRKTQACTCSFLKQQTDAWFSEHIAMAVFRRSQSSDSTKFAVNTSNIIKSQKQLTAPVFLHVHSLYLPNEASVLFSHAAVSNRSLCCQFDGSR